MFVKLINNQNLADRIKGFILDANVSSAFRKVVMRTLAEFEKTQWVPLALEDALAQQPGLTITPEEGVKFEGADEDALAAIDGMFRDYFKLIDPNLKELTTTEAAAHLHLSVEQFNTYAIRRKEISGRRLGKSWLYSIEELDRFKATMKTKGRQRKSEII